MTTTTVSTSSSTPKQSQSLWAHAWKTIVGTPLSCGALIIVLFYFLLALLTFMGVIAADWGKEIGPSYSPPGAQFLFGTDIFGRSVFLKIFSY